MLIETDRLIIRPFTISDLDDLSFLLADSEAMRFSKDSPLTREQSERMLHSRILDHYAQHGFGLWALVKDHRLIGFAGLISQQIDGEECVELGYRLLPDYWGQGLAFEASQAILTAAFTQFGLEKVISLIEAENTRSVALAKKLGFSCWKESLFHGKKVQVFRKLR